MTLRGEVGAPLFPSASSEWVKKQVPPRSAQEDARFECQLMEPNHRPSQQPMPCGVMKTQRGTRAGRKVSFTLVASFSFTILASCLVLVFLLFASPALRKAYPYRKRNSPASHKPVLTTPRIGQPSTADGGRGGPHAASNLAEENVPRQTRAAGGGTRGQRFLFASTRIPHWNETQVRMARDVLSKAMRGAAVLRAVNLEDQALIVALLPYSLPLSPPLPWRIAATAIPGDSESFPGGTGALAGAVTPAVAQSVAGAGKGILPAVRGAGAGAGTGAGTGTHSVTSAGTASKLQSVPCCQGCTSQPLLACVFSPSSVERETVPLRGFAVQGRMVFARCPLPSARHTRGSRVTLLLKPSSGCEGRHSQSEASLSEESLYLPSQAQLPPLSPQAQSLSEGTKQAQASLSSVQFPAPVSSPLHGSSVPGGGAQRPGKAPLSEQAFLGQRLVMESVVDEGGVFLFAAGVHWQNRFDPHFPHFANISCVFGPPLCSALPTPAGSTFPAQPPNLPDPTPSADPGSTGTSFPALSNPATRQASAEQQATEGETTNQGGTGGSATPEGSAGGGDQSQVAGVRRGNLEGVGGGLRAPPFVWRVWPIAATDEKNLALVCPQPPQEVVASWIQLSRGSQQRNDREQQEHGAGEALGPVSAKDGTGEVLVPVTIQDSAGPLPSVAFFDAAGAPTRKWRPGARRSYRWHLRRSRGRAGARPRGERGVPKDTKELVLCACTVSWNVAKLLPEWAAYHAWMGVERFFVYDNNSDDDLAAVAAMLSATLGRALRRNSTRSGEEGAGEEQRGGRDGTREGQRSGEGGGRGAREGAGEGERGAEERGWDHRSWTSGDEAVGVSVRPWPWPKTQQASFSHCLVRAGPLCEWVMFLDVDEFLFPSSSVATATALAGKRNTSAILTSNPASNPQGMQEELQGTPGNSRGPSSASSARASSTPESSRRESSSKAPFSAGAWRARGALERERSAKGPFLHHWIGEVQAAVAPHEIGAIEVPARSFGPSGNHRRPPQGAMAGYTCRQRGAFLGKAIVRPGAVNLEAHNWVHEFKLRLGYHVAAGDRVGAWVYHYQYPAWEEYRNKFVRRVAAGVTDWLRQDGNRNSTDNSTPRADGVVIRNGTPIPPSDWVHRFCDERDTSLADFARLLFASEQGELPWERRSESPDLGHTEYSAEVP